MKKVILLLALVSAPAFAELVDPPAWNKRNQNSPAIDTSSRAVPKHGAPSIASSFDFGSCAASIVNTQPATAQRLYNDAKARGQVDDFKAGFIHYTELAQRSPVEGWRKGSTACSGHMLQSIRFDKQDRVVEKEKK